MDLEDDPDKKSGEPENGADRKVDVAGENDHRLADRQNHQDRSVQGDPLDIGAGEKVAVADRGDHHQQHQHEKNAELAEAGHHVDQPAAVHGEASARGGDTHDSVREYVDAARLSGGMRRETPAFSATISLTYLPLSGGLAGGGGHDADGRGVLPIELTDQPPFPHGENPVAHGEDFG